MKPAAVITGASGGIGLELARLFAADGHDVVLVARDSARLARLSGELRQRHGVAAHVIAADLSAPRAADAVVDELEQRDVVAEALVNNAGFAMYATY
jgi:short-subunit dehydrogenase